MTEVALVTGAARGIGAATAERAADAGYAVLVNYSRDAEGARGVVERITARGGTARAFRADVTDERAVADMVDAATDLGELTALVNNAGVTGNHIGPLVTHDVATVRRMLDVNVTGVVLCCQAVIPHLRRGSIVNVSSTAAKRGSPGEWIPYAASKAAVNAITVGLATELAPHVRVNAVAAGLVETGLHAAAGEPGRTARIAPRVPLARAGEPDEVAAGICWLLSADAAFVTGAVLPVSGGF